MHSDTKERKNNRDSSESNKGQKSLKSSSNSEKAKSKKKPEQQSQTNNISTVKNSKKKSPKSNGKTYNPLPLDNLINIEFKTTYIKSGSKDMKEVPLGDNTAPTLNNINVTNFQTGNSVQWNNSITIPISTNNVPSIQSMQSDHKTLISPSSKVDIIEDQRGEHNLDDDFFNKKDGIFATDFGEDIMCSPEVMSDTKSIEEPGQSEQKPNQMDVVEEVPSNNKFTVPNIDIKTTDISAQPLSSSNSYHSNKVRLEVNTSINESKGAHTDVGCLRKKSSKIIEDDDDEEGHGKEVQRKMSHDFIENSVVEIVPNSGKIKIPLDINFRSPIQSESVKSCERSREVIEKRKKLDKSELLPTNPKTSTNPSSSKSSKNEFNILLANGKKEVPTSLNINNITAKPTVNLINSSKETVKSKQNEMLKKIMNKTKSSTTNSQVSTKTEVQLPTKQEDSKSTKQGTY